MPITALELGKALQFLHQFFLILASVIADPFKES